MGIVPGRLAGRSKTPSHLPNRALWPIIRPPRSDSPLARRCIFNADLTLREASLTIVGLGLMGGSLAMGCRQARVMPRGGGRDAPL